MSSDIDVGALVRAEIAKQIGGAPPPAPAAAPPPPAPAAVPSNEPPTWARGLADRIAAMEARLVPAAAAPPAPATPPAPSAPAVDPMLSAMQQMAAAVAPQQPTYVSPGGPAIGPAYGADRYANGVRLGMGSGEVERLKAMPSKTGRHSGFIDALEDFRAAMGGGSRQPFKRHAPPSKGK